MSMQAQWVVERRRTTRLAEWVADAGGVIQARSEIELEPWDLDTFGDQGSALFSILELTIKRMSLVSLIARAIRRQERGQVLVADLTRPCPQIRELRASGLRRVVLRVGEGCRGFDADHTPQALRMLERLLDRPPAVTGAGGIGGRRSLARPAAGQAA
jgi:hypothetical protein